MAQLNNRFIVLVFPVKSFRGVDFSRMSDADKLQLAADKFTLVRRFSSLHDFQTALNEDSVDTSTSFVFFITNPDAGAEFDDPAARLADIQKAYFTSDVCMAEFLASEPADGDVFTVCSGGVDTVL